MQFTGFNYRSISDQTGVVDFSFLINTPSMNNELIFGLSGTRNFQFRMFNGKVFDNENNFVDSYQVGVDTIISGQIGNRSYDYWINNLLVGQERPIGSGEYRYITFNNKSNILVEFDATIQGNKPSYQISQTGYFLGSNITGNILNLSPVKEFRIFDILINQSGTPFSISSFTTGNISSTGNFVINSNTGNISSYNLPLIFYSNFGPISADYFISGNGFPATDFYLFVAPDDQFVLQNSYEVDYDLYFSNLPQNCGINIKLSYVSGITGEIFTTIPTGGNFMAPFSGLVTGCTEVSGYYTGTITGYDAARQISVSGSGQGFLVNTFCATGLVSLYWGPMNSYGLVNTGDGVPTSATGLISGYLSGVVLPGSGCFTFPATIVSGYPQFGYTDVFNYVQATGLLYFNISGFQEGQALYFNNAPIYYTSGNYDIFTPSFNSLESLSGVVSSGDFYYFATKFDGVSGTGYLLKAHPDSYGTFGNGIMLSGDTGISGTYFVNPFLTGGADIQITGAPLTIFTGVNIVTGAACAVEYKIGFITGQLTGYLTVLDYVRTFTGLWNLTTGDISYRDNGLLSGNNYVNTSFNGIFDSPGSFGFTVNYSNFRTDNPTGSPDLAYLSIATDYGTGLNYILSGQF